MSRFAEIVCSLCLASCFAQAAGAATFTVTTTADTNDGLCDADCSLREAVAAANSSSSNDEIRFTAAFFSASQTITLTGPEIVITNNGSLKIYGPGANRLTLDGDGVNRIMTIHTATAYIDGLTFTGGGGQGAADSQRGGAIYNFGGTTVITNSVIRGNHTANAGGLANAASTVPGNLTLIHCVVADNLAGNGVGGGIQNFPNSTLTILNSTISRNFSTKTAVAGGGLEASGTVHISNSTFVRNASGDGSAGGIHFNGTSLTLNNVTIASNASFDGAGGLQRSEGIVDVRNTIIANNSSGSGSGDVVGSFVSHGNNLIGIVGTSTGWIASDLLNQPALLAPSGSYGGNGITSALLAGSPAINAGNNCVVDLSCSVANPPVAMTTDQRGAARPAGGAVDIGAFEASGSHVAVLPNAQPNTTYFQSIAPSTAFMYSVTSGSLPPGLTLTASPTIPGQAAYSITGTPTELGVFNFGITATDGTHSAVINYQIRVAFPGAPAVQTAVSRKMHGGSGTFDITLPLTAPVGIECRSGGLDGSHQVVVIFLNPVTVGGVTITSTDGLASGERSVSGAVVTIELAAVANAQTLGISLTDVSDGTSFGDLFIPMGILIGDTAESGSVNATDIGQTKAQSGEAVTGSNFRTDVTASGGSINASDVGLVKSMSGTQLP